MTSLILKPMKPQLVRLAASACLMALPTLSWAQDTAPQMFKGDVAWMMLSTLLVVMMAVRKGLDLVFTKAELKILDDILPEFKRHEKLNDEEDALEENAEYEADLAKRRASLR